MDHKITTVPGPLAGTGLRVSRRFRTSLFFGRCERNVANLKVLTARGFGAGAACLGAALAIGYADIAAAADLPLRVKAPAVPVASWTQFYVGAGLGFDFATGRTVVTDIGGRSATIDGLQGADLGLSVFAGADLQVSRNIVLGVFADWDWAHQNTAFSLDDGFGNGVNLSLPSLDRGWTVGGRAGILVTPDVLLYGLAGYSEMKINNWSATGVLGAPAAVLLQQPSYTSRGYTVGAGVEYRLSNNVSLRSEYRYVALGSATSFDAINNTSWTNDLSQHVVRVGAAYRFGNFGTVASAPAARVADPKWTGFYIGAGFGGDAVAPHVAGTVGGLNLNLAGLGGADVGGTLMAGYDRQIAPRWVVGAFALADAATNGGVRFRATAAAGGPGQVASDPASVKWSWTAGGRFGYLLAPNTLVYGLAGYSGVTLRSVSYDLFGITGTGPTPQYYGATFGGGFERYFTDTISARAEYRGTHLQTRDNLIAPGWTNLSAGGTVHTLRGVVSYRIPAL